MKKLFLSLLGVSLLVSLVPMTAARTASNKTEVMRNLSIFNALYKELQTNYVDTIDATKSIRTAIDAMLQRIDPYTEYYPTDEQDEILSISSGQYGGIGSSIMRRSNGDVIMSQPRWNAPARNAGIKHGDILKAIDGEAVTKDMAVSDVSKRLRGQAGTHVVVEVQRPYSADSLLKFDIVRGSIKVDPLPYYGILDGGVGYIKLTTFNESSARSVKDAITNMQRTTSLKGLIIDLRDNGGGLLESAVQIASNFVSKGTEIVRMRGRDNANEKIYKTTSSPIAADLPLVMLVDDGTASASEILSGSMQDLDRAVIMGERSYGKGLVQNTRPLPNNGLLKITVARYYIPSGRLIQAIDYSHRNPDGSVARIPDSLTNVYHTKAGREVRDGGGISPDVEMKDSASNRLLYNIAADLWAYDFATKYASRTPQIPDADTFEVTDTIFNEFKAFLDPDKFKYDKMCESGLDYLRDAAKLEGYMTDSVAAQFDILAGMLKHNLDHDLEFNRKAITDMLDYEITDRYYSESDMVKRSIRDDAKVEAARALLLDTERYRSLLKPTTKK
jgi:carboxyl-terminal processing protease